MSEIHDPSGIILNQLSSSGWRITDKAKTSPVAELEYDNGKMHLEVEHDDSDNSLIIRIIGNDGEIFLAAYYEKALNDVLELLIKWQDKIDRESYTGFARELLKICTVYVDTGEDMILLEDDNVNNYSIN